MERNILLKHWLEGLDTFKAKLIKLVANALEVSHLGEPSYDLSERGVRNAIIREVNSVDLRRVQGGGSLGERVADSLRDSVILQQDRFRYHFFEDRQNERL